MRYWRIVGLWAPVGAWMALLYFAPAGALTLVEFRGWDKLLHLLAYGTLAGLSLRALHGGWHRLSPWPTVMALLLAIGYGGLDELRQSHLPGRVSSWTDLLADIVGASIAVAAVGFLVRVRGNASMGPGSVPPASGPR